MLVILLVLVALPGALIADPGTHLDSLFVVVFVSINVLALGLLLHILGRQRGRAESEAERDRAYSELAHERRLLAEAQAVGRVGSFEWDLLDAAPTWSAVMLRLHDLEPDAGEPDIDAYRAILDAEDGDRVIAEMIDLHHNPREFEIEYRLAGEHDPPRVLLLRGGPVGDGDSDGAQRLSGTCRDVSDERETERRREQAEIDRRRASRFFDLSGDLLVTADDEGYFHEVNAAWTEQLGWTPEELRERPFLEFVHPGDRARTAEELATQRATSGVPFTFANRYRTRSGQWRWLEWSIIRVEDEQLFYASARDRTDQQAARNYLDTQHTATRLLARGGGLDETLGELLELLGTRLEWEAGAVFMPGRDGSLACESWWSADGVDVAALRAVTERTTPGPRDLPVRAATGSGSMWSEDLATEMDSGRARASIAAGMRAAAVLPVEVAGEVAAVIELLGASARPQDDAMVGALDSLAGQIGIYLENRAQRSALVARERETRKILESSHDAFFTIDAQGLLAEWNPSAETLFGYERHEVIGRPAGDLIVPEHRREEHERTLGQFLSTGEGVPFGQVLEIPMRRKGDGEFVGEVTMSALRTADGFRFNAFVRDITDRLRYQRELAVARDEALEASDQKSEFLANMSHEIRTPMNGVVGMTELLLETELTSEQREYAEVARSSSEALVAVVNDILDLSKIESGRLEFDSADFSPGELVEDVCELLARIAHEKGLEFSTLVESRLATVVRGDEVRVRQILLNLISNAVKFTSDGEVSVHAFPLDGAESRICFEVRDTGIGISADKLATIFESFSQADTSTTRRYGGTGLGLTITKQLTEMMGGEIAVISEPGLGSTFRAIIPFDPPGPAAGLLGAFEAPTDLQGVRILVADDNATNRFIFGHHARAWGMSITIANDGREAVTRMRRAAEVGRPFEIALIDMRMPELDGLGVAREARMDPALREVPIVLLSSSFDERDAAREAGVDIQLQKPIRRERLFNALFEALRTESPVETDQVPVLNGEREGRPRVLIAEDNEVNRLLAVRMLEKRGIDSELAHDGEAAVEVFSRESFDLVLMDCQMPKLDGYAATGQMRRLEGDGPRTPIVAMTAHSMRGDRERCLEAGMDDYLSKPLDTRAFDMMLGRWIEGVARPGTAVSRLHTRGEEELIDHQAVDRLRDQIGSGEALGRFVEIFREQTPGKLAELRAAAEAGDDDGVRSAAHFLKGSAASLGARQMARMCAELERLPASEVAAVLTDLQSAFDDSVEGLRLEVARL